MSNKNEDLATFEVLINEEEQYSIWPTGKDIPPGWTPAGKRDTKEACLEYIKAVWTDMRPLSLRKQMAA
jgi:MbtH protein